MDHLEDIQFLAPFKFYKNLPRHIQWKAQAVREEDGLVVYAKLESELERHNGQRERMLHFSGKVYLSQKPLKPEISRQIPVWGEEVTVCAEDIYKLYFHGPSFQVLDCVQRSGDLVLGRLAKNLPSATNNGSWIHKHSVAGRALFPDSRTMGSRSDRYHGFTSFHRHSDHLPPQSER